MECIFDIINKSFSINDEEKNNKYIDIYFGFTEQNKLPVYFNNLSYGFKLKKDNKVIKEHIYPENNNIIIVSSDQKYIEIIRINDLFPEIEYSLNFWIKNNDSLSECSLKIILPKPIQPYPSWLYDEKEVVWLPPTSYPNNGEQYVWNESNLSWILINN